MCTISEYILSSGFHISRIQIERNTAMAIIVYYRQWRVSIVTVTLRNFLISFSFILTFCNYNFDFRLCLNIDRDNWEIL
jgi:hypothetical protein